jgi:hypothetical protein
MSKDRKAFNFYKSYFEVYNELSDKDKVSFMDALLNKQFYGVEPNLDGLAKFAYLSQKHSIDKQVKGFEDKTDTKLKLPTQGGSVGGTQGGSVHPYQQEKEKEKEKVEYTKPKKINFESQEYKDELLEYFKQKSDENKLDLKKVLIEAKEGFDYYKELGWKNSNNKKIANLKSTIWNNWIKRDLEKFRKEVSDGFPY